MSVITGVDNVGMILVAAFAIAASAAQSPPARAGECKWVHGRYVIANGSSVRRIWIIGTRRIIALYDDDEDVPAEIDRHVAVARDDPLYGDFHVCARENSRPGWMQHVRLLKTRNFLLRGKAYPSR